MVVLRPVGILTPSSGQEHVVFILIQSADDDNDDGEKEEKNPQ